MGKHSRGRRNHGRTFFEDSARLNDLTYWQYFNRLWELSISQFEYKGLPDTVDPRYIELMLFESAGVVYFKDEVIGDLCLNCIPQGRFDVYGNPIIRRAYSRYNNYSRMLDASNSVIIWNNYLRTPSMLDVEMFALRLYNLDRIIDVNANAQKTPVLVQGTEKQRLTLLNLYKEFDGNAPVIFGDTNLDLNALKVLQTEAPFVADKIYQLKTEIWNEALTYLGIPNVAISKKERMITDEVARGQGGTVASKFARLEARKEGFDKVNKMFGTDISVDFRMDVSQGDVSMPGGSGLEYREEVVEDE